jgi:hypothetical protein
MDICYHVFMRSNLNQRGAYTMSHPTCIQCEFRRAKVSGFLCHVCEREARTEQLENVDQRAEFSIPRYAFNLSNRGAQIILREVR